MKSNGWLKMLAIAAAAVGLVLGASACTKSSESKASTDNTTNNADNDTAQASPDEAKPLESNPVDTKPKDTKPVTPEDDTDNGTAEVATDDKKPEVDVPKTPKKNPPKKNPYSSKTVSSDDSYTLKIKYPNELKNGKEGTVMVTVIPADGWKMNHEFPTKLTVSPPDGVSVTKEQQKVPDAVEFSDGKAVFAVKFTPSSSGDKAFSAKFKFAVCTSSTCDPKRTKMAWNTSVI